MHVLLVSHDATRTGAPRVAVEVAEALTGAGHDVTALLRGGGPLRSEFDRAAHVVSLEPLGRVRALVRRLLPKLSFTNRLEEVISLLVLLVRRPDVVFLNSVKSSCYVRPARFLRLPVVLYVHEIEPLASTTLRRYRLDEHYAMIGLVACSRAARANLARLSGVDDVDIALLRSPVDTARVRALGAGPGAARGAPSSALVVGACGLPNEGKGFDLWLEMVKAVRAQHEGSVRFVWVGARRDDAVERVESAGLAQVVEMPGETANPYPLIRAMDVFTLPSRADSFPLVVLEAMTLGRGVVAFAVGDVADQIGGAGVLVPPGDVRAFAGAVGRLLDDPGRREALGSAAARRAQERFDTREFAPAVRRLVEAARAGEDHRRESIVRFDAAGEPARSLVLLKSFDSCAVAVSAESRWRLPYGVDSVTRAGFTLQLSDAVLRPPWTRRPLRAAVRAVERVGAPVLQTLLMTRAIGASDVTLAMFESQGNGLAALRRLGIPPFTKPTFAIVECWLARDVQHFGSVRRFVYSQVYRTVDRVFFFSSNQAAILERELGVPEERLRFVHFGVDHRTFAPRVGNDGGYALAVGRDLGHDWPTLLAAFDGLDIPLKLATRPGRALRDVVVPPNVEDLGYVDRARYQELLAGARLVVVTTHELEYPTGQTVTLEAMAMGKCCVVTGTVPMSDYLRAGENALVVPPGDAPALRAAVERAWQDDELRRALGGQARRDVEETFNADSMWASIGRILQEACDERRIRR